MENKKRRKIMPKYENYYERFPVTLFECHDEKTKINLIFSLKKKYSKIEEILKVVKMCGATVGFNRRDTTIYSAVIVDHNEVVNFHGPTFNMNYITDCLRHGKLLDIGTYRQEATKQLSVEDSVCMQVIYYRKFGWNSVMKQEDKLWIDYNFKVELIKDEPKPRIENNIKQGQVKEDPKEQVKEEPKEQVKEEPKEQVKEETKEEQVKEETKEEKVKEEPKDWLENGIKVESSVIKDEPDSYNTSSTARANDATEWKNALDNSANATSAATRSNKETSIVIKVAKSGLDITSQSRLEGSMFQSSTSKTTCSKRNGYQDGEPLKVKEEEDSTSCSTTRDVVFVESSSSREWDDSESLADQAKAKNSRQPYTRDEQCKILKYIVENHEYSKIKGKEMWVIMERKKVCPTRTWQSMKEHFLKKIIFNLDNYDILTREQKKRIQRVCF